MKKTEAAPAKKATPEDLIRRCDEVIQLCKDSQFLLTINYLEANIKLLIVLIISLYFYL